MDGGDADSAAARAGRGARKDLREVRALTAAAGAGAAPPALAGAVGAAYRLAHAARGLRAAEDRLALASALRRLGGAVFATGDHPAAQQVYRAALELFDGDARLHGNVASCCLNMGDFYGCVRACDSALVLLMAPGEPAVPGFGVRMREGRLLMVKVLKRKAKSLIRMENWDEARAALHIVHREGTPVDDVWRDLYAQVQAGWNRRRKRLWREECEGEEDEAGASEAPDTNASASDLDRMSGSLGSSETDAGSGGGRDADGEDSCEVPSLGGSESSEVPSLGESDSDGGLYGDGLLGDGSGEEHVEECGDKDMYEINWQAMADAVARDTAAYRCAETPASDPATVTAPAGFRAGFLDQARPRHAAPAAAAAPPPESDEPPALGMSDDDGDDACGPSCGSSSGERSDEDADGSGSSGDVELHLDDSDARLSEGTSDGECNSGTDEGMPGLADSESDEEVDITLLDAAMAPPVHSVSDGGGDLSFGEPPQPVVDSSSAGCSSKRPEEKKKGKAKKKTEPCAVDIKEGYDSATSSYSVGLDEDDRSVFQAEFMPDERVRSQLGPSLQAMTEGALGKSFMLPQRGIDFDRFFGAHIPKAGTKAPKKKGKRPLQCSQGCGNCWARRMWRARFPWRPADGSSSSSSTQPASSSSAIPDGLSDSARNIFLATGGFGSGRELHVSLIGAVVHSFAYICLLQCEMSWRDEQIMPRVKDAQSCLQAMLSEDINPMEAESVTYQVGLMLNVINQCIVDGYFRSASLAWDIGYRSSEVCKKVAEDVRAPKLSISASTMTGLPVTASNKDFALYSNGYAWARVGRIDRDEELVFATLARDAAARSQTNGNERVFELCMHDGIAMTCHALDFARVIRRCLYERAKYMELQAGDVEISGDPMLPTEPPYTRTPLFKAAVALAAENVNAAQRMESDGRGDAADAVHLRAVILYSEALKRVPRPRLLLKRAKRYMQVGKLSDAQNDLKKAKSIVSNMHVTSGSAELLAEVRRVFCVLHLRFMSAADGAAKRLEFVDEAFKEIMTCHTFARCVSRDTMARLFWLNEQVERLVNAALAAREAEEGSDPEEAPSFEPEPADLPSTITSRSGPSSTSAPAATVFEESSEVTKSRDAPPSSDDAGQYLGDEICSFKNCSKPTRRILRKEEWAETQCECCIIVQCHKNCYRSHSKLSTSNLCPKCADYPVVGKPIYMTVETADEKRSKRVPVCPDRSSARPTRAPVSEKTAAGSVTAENSGCESGAGPSSRTERASASTANSVTADRSKVSAPSRNISREVTSTKSTSCDVCNKHFNGPKQFEMHMASQKHIQKVSSARRSEEANTSTGSAYSPKPWTSSAPHQVNGEVGVASNSSFVPHFTLSAAVQCVKTALRTFPNGEARLSELRPALDMTSYGVSDAGKYFDENWMGLRTFVGRQVRHFIGLQENFRDYDFRVRIYEPAIAPPPVGTTVVADRSTVAPWSRPSSASRATAASWTAAASAPIFSDGSFPALSEGSGALEMETTAREPPAEFRFGSSSKTTSPVFHPENVEGYLAPGEDVANACVICIDRTATHRIASCACAGAYCDPCIQEWIEKQERKGRGGKKRSATCPTCTSIIGDIVRL